MKRVTVVMVLALVACGSPSNSTANVSITPSGVASPTSGSAAATSPSSTSECRLPVGMLAPDATDPARRDVGFVSVPGGTLSLSDDAITYEPQTGLFRTVNQPYLYGQDDEAYDVAAGRWLPTTRLLISPDGTRYAYQAPGALDSTTGSYGPSSIHVVDVASANDRQVAALGVFPLAFVPSGILVITASASNGPISPANSSLLLMDPLTGSTRQLTNGSVGWMVATSAYAFGTDLNPADPSPLIQSPFEPAQSRAPDRAWRLDLATGTVEPWLYRPGRLVETAGVDSQGRLIVVVVGLDGTEVWALTAPETGARIYTGPGHSQSDPLGLNNFGITRPGIADEDAFWLSTGTGIVRESSGGELKLVFQGQATPAGPCI